MKFYDFISRRAFDWDAFPDIDVRSCGVLRSNTAARNKTNLQKAMDRYTGKGANLHFAEYIYLDPVDVRTNINLMGNNVSAYKGSGSYGSVTPAPGVNPAGAAFLNNDVTSPLLTMHTNTSIEGFVLYKPDQNYNATTIAATTAYPPTIKSVDSAGVNVVGVSCRRLAFVGDTSSMEFIQSTTGTFLGDLDISQCYGYSLGGPFLSMNYVADIPRINRCHVNPTCGLAFLGDNDTWGSPYKQALKNDIVANSIWPAFFLVAVDDIMVDQCFVFGQNIGFQFQDTYGVAMNSSIDTCAWGYRIYWPTTSNNRPRVMSLVGCRGVTLMGAANNGVVYDGDFTSVKGALKLCDFNIDNGTTTQSLVNVAGSGGANQILLLVDNSVTYGGVGVWTNTILKTNTLATVLGTPIPIS